MNTRKIATIAMIGAVLLATGCKKERIRGHRDVPYMPRPRVEASEVYNAESKSRINRYKFVQPDDWARNFYKKLRMENYL